MWSHSWTIRSFGYINVFQQQYSYHFNHLQDDVASAMLTEDPSAVEINLLATYLFAAITYGNWQRAGAALNLTLAEAQAARLVDGKYTIAVADHKTGQSHGPAVLVLSQSDGRIFQHYLNTVRPLLPCSSQNSDVALLTSRGKSLTNYIGLLKTLTKRYGLGRLPTITLCRKAGATDTVEQGATREDLERLGEHMSHSVETSEKYYRQRHRRNVAVATHTAIHQTMSEYLKFTLYWFSISCISGRSTAVTEPERGFSEGAVEKMRQFFAQAIARGARPTSSLCRQFLAQESISNKSPKQVQDKVYTLRDK